MRAILKSALITTMLIGSSLAFAQDAKGWFEEYCDGASFHFEKFAGKLRPKEFVLWYRSQIRFDYYTDWFDVQVCSAAQQPCDYSAKAQMKLLQRKKRAISGRYAVDFGGKHLEGEFRFKEHRHKHLERLCM